MIKILLWQFVVALAVAILCGVAVADIAAFWSALAGGASYFIPSAAAVLILSVFKPYPKLAGYGFLVGEGLKIVLALVLMVGVFALYHEKLVFIPFFLGLLAVSHVVFFVLWKVQRYGKCK